jgi:hypothetical protein
MIPDWALKFKVKGTALEKHGKEEFYLYKVHSERTKDKPYPVLIHDELIGIVSKNGLTYSTRKIIDVTQIEVIPVIKSNITNLLNGNDSAFRSSYLIKVQNRWYFSKLSEEQKTILKKFNLDYQRGIADVKEKDL